MHALPITDGQRTLHLHTSSTRSNQSLSYSSPPRLLLHTHYNQSSPSPFPHAPLTPDRTSRAWTRALFSADLSFCVDPLLSSPYNTPTSPTNNSSPPKRRLRQLSKPTPQEKETPSHDRLLHSYINSQNNRKAQDFNFILRGIERDV
jgi:hypothetical protein